VNKRLELTGLDRAGREFPRAPVIPFPCAAGQAPSSGLTATTRFRS
jgi:hypothetical protein